MKNATYFTVVNKYLSAGIIRHLSFSFFLLFVSLLVTITTKAQAIVETFDDATATTALSCGNIITVNSTSTTTSAGARVGTFAQVIGASALTTSIRVSQSGTSSTSAAGLTNIINIGLVTALVNFGSTTTASYTSSATVSASANGPASTGTYTWYYGASGTRLNISSGTSGYHSGNYYIDMPQNNTFLITPGLTGGIAQVRFWMSNPGAGNGVKLALKTNVTATPIYPTDFNDATAQFNLNTSSYTVVNGMSATTANIVYTSSNVIILGSGAGYPVSNTGTVPLKISQFTYNVPTSLQGSPAQIAFMVSNGSGADVYIDDIEIVGACARGTWTGTVNSDWNTPGNWSCGILPSSGANVIIPNVSPNPEPVLSGNVTVGDITLNSTATVSLNGYTFTVNGTSLGTGTYSGSASSGLSFTGTTSSTIYFTSDVDILKNLSLSDGANITLGSALNIASTGTVTVGSVSGATLVSDDNLTLVSDDNGSARVAPVPVNGSGNSLSTIGGNVNVQCYIHSNNSSVPGARRAWRMLTAPVSNNNAAPASSIFSAWQSGGVYTPGTGTMITAPPGIATGAGGNGLDDGINQNYSLEVWNTVSQQLVTVNNTLGGISNATGNADNLGYFIFVRGDRDPSTVNDPSIATINNTTLSATGTLQLGDQTFSSGSGIVSTTAGGLSLIGNPYANSVDFSILAGDNASYHTSYLNNIINRVYIWNSNLTGSSGVGGYVCMDDAGYTGTYTRSIGQTGTATAADLSLQSGEAFLLQTQAAGAASITFKEFAKNTTNNYIYRPAEEEDIASAGESFNITLSLPDSNNSSLPVDGVVAQFKNTYCDCVDYMDAPKITGPNELLSLSRNGKLLCIERRPDISAGDTLFLNVAQLKQRQYRFDFTTALSDHPGLVAYLKDSYTGTHTLLNLNSDNRVSFVVTGDTNSRVADRFMVVFAKPAIAPVYASSGTIIVYPDPIQNEQIGMKLNNMPAGEYRYRLLNEIGEVVQVGDIIHSGGSALYNIPMSGTNDKGVYELEVSGPDNNTVTIRVVN